ncbi:hypothetical protein IDJ81_10630 [Tsuneonella flava]|uniref:Phytoene synthase n=1 Tax=Tsuneonella flava TaxID=2055955 RepID=A0ABX7K6G3_9SPHN|nr:hypothetical protein [Tsuneonella flava]QSB43808.1 hypothetical protein IDJ81_10630 [Tsuneonella flava]
MANDNTSVLDPLATTTFSEERTLALAHMKPTMRRALKLYFALDARLARQVAQAREPMLGQIRLAWWRDQLKIPAAERAQGDQILDAVEVMWGADASVLLALVDGWEELLGEAPLTAAAISQFAAGRAQPLAAFIQQTEKEALVEQVIRAGKRWALVDFAWKTSEAVEHETALGLARQIESTVTLPRSLRGIQVLDRLACHSLKTATPLFTGRSAAFVALRVGLIGR